MDTFINAQQDTTLQAHRGSYKTTCVSIALAVLMLTDPNQSMIFMRKTDSDIAEIIRQVKKILTSDVMQDMAYLIHGTALSFEKDTGSELDTNLRHSARGTSQLIGMGVNGSMTGKHADRIFTDDIVNLRDRLSRSEREHTKMVYQELQNIRNRGGVIINTGTPWHKDDAFTLMPNRQTFDCYHTGLIAPDKLDEIRRSMSPSLFAANYELRHIASDNALFSTTPSFTKNRNLFRDGIAHIDAAYNGEDYTAFTCASRIGGKIYLYGKMWRAHVDTVLDKCLTEADRLLCAPIYCETNGDKGYLSKEIRRRGSLSRPYPEHQNKYLKISTYLRKWWSNIVFLDGTDPEYIAQILDYTETAEHDDAVDSAACCVRILDKLGG